MATLTEFLLARIAEDERAAQEWHRIGCDYLDAAIGSDRYDYPCDCEYPARVLAECQAKRAIMGLHPPEYMNLRRCATCVDNEDGDSEVWPCPTLLSLAAVYADHPNHDPMWRI